MGTALVGTGGTLATPHHPKQTPSSSEPLLAAEACGGAAAVLVLGPCEKTTSFLEEDPREELVTGLSFSIDASSSRRPSRQASVTEELVIGLTTASSLHPPWLVWSTFKEATNKYAPSFVPDPEAPKS